MGLILSAPSADYSAISVASLKLNIATGSPTHVFETRTSASIATRNNVSGGLAGSLFGSPTFNANSMDSNHVNGVSFGIGQTANCSLGVVFKNTSLPSTNSSFLGAFPGVSTVTANGGAYFILTASTDTIAYETTVHNGGSFQGVSSASMASPAGDAYELFIATLNSSSGVTLYHPRTGSSAFGAIVAGAGNSFLHPVQTSFAAGQQNIASNPTEEVLMFARWNSVLSASDVAAVYTTVKDYYGAFGVNL